MSENTEQPQQPLYPEMRTLPAFRLLGRSTELDFRDPEIATKLADFNTSFADEESDAIIAASNNVIKGLLQVNDFGDMTREESTGVRYWRASTVDADSEHDRFEVRDVRRAFWVVFPLRELNANTMAHLRSNVIPQWFAQNAYVQAPEVELTAVHPGELAEATFWVPVMAKL